MPNATIEDVARRAGVSIKTVSRVINQEPNVRESTRACVNRAVAELDYRPNPSARNLRSRRSHLIGLIYDDPSSYDIPSSGYVVNMQQGVLEACRPAAFDLLIHPCNYRSKTIGKELRRLVEHTRLVGVVLAPPLSNMARITRAIEATDTPLVRISPGNNNKHSYSVVTNDREISAEMTRYLASLGHQRIAFITGHPDHKAVANRLLGYRDGLEQSKLKVSERLIVAGDNSIASGEACAERLLDRKSPPSAIFAANDDMAAGVIRIAHARGIDVPTELSVAGFDDVALAQQIYPRLTTIKQPLEAMAKRAAAILIDGQHRVSNSNRQETVPASLVIRQSTGPAPGYS